MRTGIAFLLAAALVLPRADAEPMAPQSSDRLVELVRPIALYPDALLAQVFAASMHPDEVMEAERWLEQHRRLNPQELAQAVDGQAWDPGVKALTQFPALLEEMSLNRSSTAALGDAYASAPRELLRTVQTLRRRAQASQSLASTRAQRVLTDGWDIMIDPIDPTRIELPGGPVHEIGGSIRYLWAWYGWDVDWRQGVAMYHGVPHLWIAPETAAQF